MLLCLALIWFGLAGNAEGSTCPPFCRCLWRSSKITVECIELGLEHLPVEVDAATQVLNLTGNNITTLKNKEFQLAGLVNLQRVTLAAANLTNIEEKAFLGLLNLVELDLSFNRLTSVPSSTFSFTLTLVSLSLANNPIRSIIANQFQPLRGLLKLDLSYCRIDNIEEEAFSGLQNLERLSMHGNVLHVLPGVLPGSLHGVTLHENPWNCDCKLRTLKHWLDSSNVPRQVEPTCSTPSRLLGFRVGTLSNPEFACAPIVKPGSSFLTIEEGEDVTLICHVDADPAADIYWTFNGRKVEENVFKFSTKQLYEGSQGYRSELRITNISSTENGSFSCSARNKAGVSMSNFTLSVSHGDISGAMELKLEHFVVVSICVIIVLLLLVIAVTLLLIHLCRKYGEKPRDPRPPTHMPKYIQMGTGKLTASPSNTSYLATPDILTEISNFQLTPDSSCISMDTVSTPAYSEHTDVSIIMQDYGNIDKGNPIIGGVSRNPGIEERKYLGWVGGNQSISRHFYGTQRREKKEERREERRDGEVRLHPRNQDQEDRRENRTVSSESINNYLQNMFSASSQELYPDPVRSVSNIDSTWSHSTLDSTWARNNPYLHTSRPYIVPLTRPVRSDEQYPVPSLEFQSPHYPDRLSSSRLSDPLYESISSVRFAKENIQDGVGRYSRDGKTIQDGVGIILRNGETTQAGVGRFPRDGITIQDGAGRFSDGKENIVIRTEDSVQDILRKLSGEETVVLTEQPRDSSTPNPDQTRATAQGYKEWVKDPRNIEGRSHLEKKGQNKEREVKNESGKDKGKDGEENDGERRVYSWDDRFDSPDISKELETAFFNLDAGETEI